MEKRVVLFLVLSLGIIFGYDLLLKQLGYSPFSTGPILDQEITPIEAPKKPEAGIQTPPPPEFNSINPPSNEPVVTEEMVSIETPLYRAGISGR
ncbi:MAG: hypothetical protein P8X46_12915, partial [Nitrospirales bacterium]